MQDNSHLTFNPLDQVLYYDDLPIAVDYNNTIILYDFSPIQAIHNTIVDLVTILTNLNISYIVKG